MEGYIKLHRKLLENPLVSDPHFAWLWVVLLLKANHDYTELMWDGGIIKMKPGQFITGRKKLAKETGVNEYKVERILKYLENTQQIEQQTNNRFRIITIVNWTKYQIDVGKLHNKPHNKRTTDAQQMHTDKNDKNDNNEKKGVLLLLKDWNERQTSPIANFKPENIINKYGAKRISEMIITYGRRDNGFSQFLKALKN